VTDRINWVFVATAGTYGFLCAMLAATMAVGTAEHLPTAWGWIKIFAGSVGAFVGGVFLYTRNPEGAWNIMPGGKPQ